MRILIIKLSSLGDLFHALPTVHMLRNAYPDATIDWVTHSTYKPLVACFTDVNGSIGYPRHSFRKDGRAFLRELRREPYDLILDLQGLLKSAAVAKLARGTRRIGPSFHREGSHLLYHAVAGPRNLERHAVEQILDVIDDLGIKRSKPVFPVAFPSRQDRPPSPHIVIAPASRWPSKNWPPERFAETARALQKEGNASISIIGAPGEEAICETVAKALDGHCQNYAGQTSLVEMGSILASANLLLANDSGPVHMAAAIGTPTVVVFGPTNPVRIGPYGEGHQVLLPSTPCMCGRTRICKTPQTACINEIPADAAIHAANRILTARAYPRG
ncbi:MAG: glycosyltransferase family 9 protein [Kiritimatiellia bacterium]